MEVKIVLDDSELSIIKEFAEKIDTGFYATRNQFNASKRTTDQITGKMGEFAVYKYLSPKINISKPDCNIYKRSEKSWDFDLKAENINMHVKSQSLESGERYGISWIFQHNDKEVFNSTKPNQFVSFVSVDMQKAECIIRSIIKLEDLHNNKLFKLPKLKKLQEMNKLAVYFKDIEYLGICL
jgi:hypothetical protein